MIIVLDIITWIFLLAGSFFAIVGAIGIVRLPEFFSRLHGGGITDTLGAALIIIGLFFQSHEHGGILVIGKLAMILFFLLVTSPTSCHALAKSALAQGLSPVLELNSVETNKKESKS